MRDFIRIAFSKIGYTLRFEGEGVDEIEILDEVDEEVAKNILQVDQIKNRKGDILVKIDPKYFRPTEVDLLIGDVSKAKEKLGWEPKFDLAALVDDMMVLDIALFKKDFELMKAGHKVLVQEE